MAKHPGGRPTKYNQEILDKTNAYYLMYAEAEELIEKNVVTKDADGNEVVAKRWVQNPLIYKPPYIEELSLLLDIDDDTINRWKKKHPEFYATIKKIVKLQKVRLLNSTMNKNSNVGAIFQLKCNHDMIETEKRQVDITTAGKPFNVGVVSYQESTGNGHK